LQLRAILDRRSAIFTGQAVRGGLVVAVPTAQGGVASVGKKKLQRRRFNVAVAKYHAVPG
jgi:hypothetical protein